METQGKRSRQPISEDAFCTIAGAQNLNGVIYLMLVPFGTCTPHMVCWHEDHVIWQAIANQLGIEDVRLITISPGLIMGHEIYPHAYLKEQYYDHAFDE